MVHLKRDVETSVAMMLWRSIVSTRVRVLAQSWGIPYRISTDEGGREIVTVVAREEDSVGNIHRKCHLASQGHVRGEGD